MLLVGALCTFVLGRVSFFFRRAPIEFAAVTDNADRDVNVVHLPRSEYRGGTYFDILADTCNCGSRSGKAIHLTQL